MSLLGSSEDSIAFAGSALVGKEFRKRNHMTDFVRRHGNCLAKRLFRIAVFFTMLSKLRLHVVSLRRVHGCNFLRYVSCFVIAAAHESGSVQVVIKKVAERLAILSVETNSSFKGVPGFGC